MKKILALTLTSMLVLGGSVAAGIATAETEALPAAPTETSAAETTQNNLYLVPGTYKAQGEKKENGIGDGAEKLTEEQCGAIYTENAYLCTLTEGAALPVPTSEREGYTFNGWWTIVDATVTYFDKVPAHSETTFLYADWRTDLSQRKDPVEPSESTTIKPMHYMVIKHTNGEEEMLTLRVSGSADPSAAKLGYDRAVELYNGWFELSPGDTISIYTVGLTEGIDEAEIAPLDVTGRKITLENGESGNNTASFVTSSAADATLTYRKVLKKRHFRIYVKFYSKGANMAVYMEPMD